MVDRSQDIRRFDVRSISWYMKQGRLTKQEYEEYLASLPDAADKAVPITATLNPVARDGRVDQQPPKETDEPKD